MVLRPNGLLSALTVGVVCAAVLPALAAAPEAPAMRPSGRSQAVAVIAATVEPSHPCLTPVMAGLRGDIPKIGLAARRALAAIYADAPLAGERRVSEADGITVRWSADRWSFDRVDGSDADGNGRPDAVDAAVSGVRAARRFLAFRDFPATGPVEIVLARLGSGVEGLSLIGSGRDGRTVLVLDGQLRPGTSAIYRSAAHQYAHAAAAALGSGLPTAWAESLASWVGLSVETDDRALETVARRLEKLADGLTTEDLDLASGNSVWLAFLDTSYGATAVRLALDELTLPGGDVAAFDRALRRSINVTFAEAFREFQLWTVLVGDRADAFHFPFAARLPSPTFTSRGEGLPAVSVLGDPAVAPAGATVVRLAPTDGRGGMTVRVEGEVGALWEADLLLVRDGRVPHRLAVPIGLSGAGEVTVPLEGVTEALLLVRNVDPEMHGPRRFTWSAFGDTAYPFELGSLAAEPNASGNGVVISWETLSEAGAIGFNVLRNQESGDRVTVRINPVWMPAVGDRTTAALYQLVDVSAESGVTYVYRVEAITPQGLTSLSRPVVITPPQ